MWNLGLLHTSNLGGWWTALQRLLELDERRLWAVGEYLHRPVPQVAREPAEAQAFGLPPDEPPETHTLDQTLHAEARSRHATTPGGPARRDGGATRRTPPRSEPGPAARTGRRDPRSASPLDSKPPGSHPRDSR